MKKRIFKFLKWFFAIFFSLVLIFLLWVYFSTYHPNQIQAEKVVNASNIPILSKGQKLKVLSWNVQYMASKNYVFFYDVLDGSGKDIRPSSKDIKKTLQAVAKIIKQENPDIILLQEVDDNAQRTDYEDQLKELLKLLPKEYKAHTSAWYWLASFVPHPKIWGRVGMKLSIISKYQISEATRYQLPLIPDNWLMQQFNLKRAIQEAKFPLKDGGALFVLNTHLDAFAQGTNTMQKQVAQIEKLLDQRTEKKQSWLIGGDFNLLPSIKSYQSLQEYRKAYYQEKSELLPFFKKYQAVPSQTEADGKEQEKWFTHFPNDPRNQKPNSIIDYIFLDKKLKVLEKYVLQKDTWTISDHLPVIVEFSIEE